MADTTKTKVLNINTTQSEKNVKSLKTQLRELREQLATLEKGTVEYDRVAQQLADTTQKQIEIQEAAKYSNRDVGQTLSNLTNVAAGVVGAISSVNSVMVLMGADSEEAQEAMKNIQALMAVIQGLGAIDTATKALKGLSVAFKDFNTERGVNIGMTLGSAGAMATESGALVSNTKEMLSNNDIAKAYDKANQENARTTNQAADAIKRETELLTENRKVKSEGDTQLNTHILDEYDTKLQHLRGEYEELSMNSEMWDEDIAKLAGQIDAIEKLSQNYARLNYKQKAYTESIGQGAEVEQKALKELGEAQAILTGDFEQQLASVKQRMYELDQLQDKVGELYSLDSDEGVKVMEKFNKLNIEGAEYVDRLEDAESALNAEYVKLAATELTLVDAQKEIIKYIPDQQLFDTVSKYNTLKAEETYKALSKASREMFEAQANGMEDAIEKERQYQEMQAAFNETDDSKRLDEIYAELAGRDELYKSYAKEIEVRKEKGVWTDVEVKQSQMATKAENDETAALEANNAVKQANAKSTEELAAEEKKLADETKKTVPIHKVVIEKIKKGWKGLVTFVKANPVFAAITGTIALLTAAWKIIDHFVAKANKEYREAVELQNRFNTEFNTQKVDMDALLRMYQSETTTLKEKESLAKEINKLAGDEVITKNELTGVLEINNGKLAEYNERLRTSIQLDYHKQQIQELMAKEEEARNNALNERTKMIGKLLRTEKGYLKDAADLVAEQEKHWKEIEKLTSGTVKNIDATSKPTKTTSGGSGIVRTFKEIFKDIQAEFRKVVQDFFDARELRMRYNGVYTETDALLLRIDKLVKSKGLGDKLGEQLKTALNKGGEGIRNYGITLDFIFSDDAFNKLEESLIKEQETLSKMLQKKSGGAALDNELKKQKEIVSELETQLKDMTELANAVQDYADAWDKAAQKNKELTDNISRYNGELKIQRDATIAERGNNQIALAEEQVKSAQLNLEYAKKQFEQDKKHRDLLQEKFEQEKNNQKVYESYIEYRQKTFESQKAYYEAIAQMDNALYSQRQVKLEEERNTMRKGNEEIERLTSSYNNFLGFMHFDDYNTPVLQIQTQIEGVERLIEQTKNYYDQQEKLYEGDGYKQLSLAAERNAAMSQLQQEQAENEIALEQAKTNRKIEIQRTYVNLYQSLTSQISGLLSAEMQNYDENSFKYKKLRYAQGVIDVSSGVLSAFMSGIQSGVPAPWNLGVAAAMAGITLATGIANLKAIKNGTLANAPSAQTVDFGTYDTLSYQQNADIISSIRDQKVYVTEQDISSTQNRVRVTETNAVF